MISIHVTDNYIYLKSLERNQLERAAELYNCSSNIHYATGICRKVHVREIEEKLTLIEATDNEFIAGIHINSFNMDDRCQLVLAGLISGELRDNSAWIKLILISPEYRNNGFGSRAVNMLSDYFKNRFKVTEVFLSVVRENTKAITFWMNNGFSILKSMRKSIFNEQYPEQIVIMYKKL